MLLPSIYDFERVVFFTGAGISAESGVPTFRGPGGIWKQYDFERYACQKAFDEDPKRVWDFHNYRRELVSKCSPNKGHEAIALAERLHPDVTVVTQNIDGLHGRASSARVFELHGSLWRIRCDACHTRRDNHDVPFTALACACGKGTMRPDITWFYDALDGAVLDAAAQRVARATLFVSVGTSGLVYPAAGLPLAAKRAGAIMVEINPEDTDASALYSTHLRGTAADMLPRLVAQ